MKNDKKISIVIFSERYNKMHHRICKIAANIMAYYPNLNSLIAVQ